MNRPKKTGAPSLKKKPEKKKGVRGKGGSKIGWILSRREKAVVAIKKLSAS